MLAKPWLYSKLVVFIVKTVVIPREEEILKLFIRQPDPPQSQHKTAQAEEPLHRHTGLHYFCRHVNIFFYLPIMQIIATVCVVTPNTRNKLMDLCGDSFK